MHMEQVDEECIALMQKILKISSEQCRVENYEDSDVWDSLKHMELIMEFETYFSIDFDEEEMIEMTSLKSIAAILQKKLMK